MEIKKYRNVISPVHLYGCYTWSVTLQEEHRLGVSEVRVLRKIFGLMKDEGTGEWRILHHDELYEL